MTWEEISGLVTASAAVVGVIVAGRGLHTWREQLRGTSERELAINAKKAAIRFRSSVRSCRSCFNDWNQNGSFDEKKAREAYFKPVCDAYQTLYDSTLELCATTSLDQDKLIIPFRKIQINISTSIWGYYSTHRDLAVLPHPISGEDRESYEKLIKRQEEIENVLYDHGTIESPDDFSTKLNHTYDELVGVLDGFIKPSKNAEKFCWRISSLPFVQKLCRPVGAGNQKKG
jgi:hypothetical protein